MPETAINAIVDLERYPLHALDDAADLIGRIRRQLAEDGACALPRFVRPAALDTMVREAQSVAHLAYPGPTEATPYFFNYDLGGQRRLPAEHPLRRTTPRNLAQVAADLIPAEHLLSRLYHASCMTGFLSRVAGRPVYRNADRYQCLNISIMRTGGCQQWHFDVGDMVTTLMLQAPEAGGVFEYVPGIRTPEDENFERVGYILDGGRGGIRRVKLQAGSLNLFKGHYSLHRVTRVRGGRHRIQAILGYSLKPGLTGNIKSSILHYGPRVGVIS